MSIQGEIREGIEYTIMINRPYLAGDIADKILKYLDSKGVVIRANRDVDKEGLLSLEMAIVERLVEE